MSLFWRWIALVMGIVHAGYATHELVDGAVFYGVADVVVALLWIVKAANDRSTPQKEIQNTLCSAGIFATWYVGFVYVQVMIGAVMCAAFALILLMDAMGRAEKLRVDEQNRL